MKSGSLKNSIRDRNKRKRKGRTAVLEVCTEILVIYISSISVPWDKRDKIYNWVGSLVLSNIHKVPFIPQVIWKVQPHTASTRTFATSGGKSSPLWTILCWFWRDSRKRWMITKLRAILFRYVAPPPAPSNIRGGGILIKLLYLYLYILRLKMQ